MKTEINEKLKNLHTEIETRKNYKKIKEKYQNALTLYDQGEYEKAYYELEKILKEEQIQKDENFKTQIKSKMNEISEKARIEKPIKTKINFDDACKLATETKSETYIELAKEISESAYKEALAQQCLRDISKFDSLQWKIYDLKFKV